MRVDAGTRLGMLIKFAIQLTDTFEYGLEISWSNMQTKRQVAVFSRIHVLDDLEL